MRINFERLKNNGYYGVAFLIAIISSCFALVYLLMHDPYKDLHEQIFEIAGKVNSYYRERPSYWKLSTASAAEDNLIGNIRKEYKEYDFSIGQGINGDISMPSDVSFDISIKHLSKSACVSLSEYQIPEEKRLSLLKITIYTDNNPTVFSWGEAPKLPVEKYAARNICASKENTIVWTFQ